jgi:hypothetical protein
MSSAQSGYVKIPVREWLISNGFKLTEHNVCWTMDVIYLSEKGTVLITTETQDNFLVLVSWNQTKGFKLLLKTESGFFANAGNGFFSLLSLYSGRRCRKTILLSL